MLINKISYNARTTVNSSKNMKLIQYRTLMRSIQNAGKIVSSGMNRGGLQPTKLTPTTNTNQIPNRPMTCIHAGDRKPGSPIPKTKSTDISGKHKIVVQTKCTTNPDCEKTNCANVNDPKATLCPGKTPQTNQISIPKGPNFFTKIIGNATTHTPKGVEGKVINANRNYKGENKPQAVATEKQPIKIDPNDVVIHNQSTRFFQEEPHHKILTNEN